MDTNHPYDDTIHGWPHEQQRETVSRPEYYRPETSQQQAQPAQPRPTAHKQEQRMPKYQARMLAGKLKNSSLIMSLGAFGLMGVLIGTHIPAAAQTISSSDPNSTNTGTQNTSPWSSQSNNNSGNNPWSSQNQGGQSIQGNNGGFFRGGGNYGFGNGGSMQSPSTRSRTS